jgi:hypothetical protein
MVEADRQDARAKKIERRFTFHELHAYYVSRHKAERGMLPALDANPATTARADDLTKIAKRRSMSFSSWE